MLNIGLLAPGAGEYYIGEVATSAEDYYTGRGETAGRWVGSLAEEVGLRGEVSPDDFRAVLAGLDPFTGEQLVHRKASASPKTGEIRSDRSFDVLQAASALGVSGQYVRRLLQEGDRYSEQLAGAAPGVDVAAPKHYLLGGLGSRGGNGWGSTPWTISGEELQRFAASRTEKKFRPGYDLTLRPPKSVSVLWALGGSQIAGTVRDAHTAAVDQVVAYYEHHAVRARSPQSGRRVETHGMIAAAFDHRTSRAGDPLLHTHVVTANMTRFDTDDEKGVWRAVESSALFDHAKAAGCLYQAHLRYELSRRLGIAFTPTVNGYAEVAGVPDKVIELFSKRRNEIEEELAATGRSSARSAQVATLETRRSKDYSVDADTLTANWVREAAEVGFTPKQAQACVGVAAAVDLTDADAEALFTVLAGAHGMCERSSTFRRSDVIESIAALTDAKATAGQIGELADRFLASGQVIAVLPGASVRGQQRRSNQNRWTTVEFARIEKSLLDRASQTLLTGEHRLPVNSVEAVVASRPELSDEQAVMVERVCASDQFVLPVEGRPGAGKTYATEAVVAAYVAGSVPILGCAVSAAAAAELETQAGFARSVTPATTVAKLLWDLDRFDGLAAGSVVVVDEASMIGTRDLSRLAAHVERADGRIVLVGDPDQHGSVDAGGVFARLCADQGDDLVRLVENRRQGDHVDRLAIDDYRNGMITDALQRLDDADRIVRSATAGESFDAMAADWYAARSAGSVDPMIAGPNSTRRALNERARVLLKAAGELAGDAMRVSGREFMVGDEVVARRNARNLHAAGSKDFVKNGSVGTIERLHPDAGELTVRFDTEGTIRIPARYLNAGRLEHGYARTTYGVQGHTHDVARYHPTDASGFEEGYVAVTRGRQGARLYVVDGTVEVDQDTHHTRATERHALDDITTAFGRRRANTMAAESSPNLDRIADLAATLTLAELHARSDELDRQLRQLPGDTAHVAEEAVAARDALLARQRLLEVGEPGSASGGLQRRIDHLDRRIVSATSQQDRRDQWLEEHADLVEERDVMHSAERAVEARIRQHPTAHLPARIVAALGPEPSLQRERHAWSAAASAVAVHRHRYGIDHDDQTSVGGAAAMLGERPADLGERVSWEYAAAKLTEARIGAALESGAEL
ncbi:MAG: MobF family relaxase [Microthrixaceae bacterium]